MDKILLTFQRTLPDGTLVSVRADVDPREVARATEQLQYALELATEPEQPAARVYVMDDQQAVILAPAAVYLPDVGYRDDTAMPLPAARRKAAAIVATEGYVVYDCSDGDLRPIAELRRQRDRAREPARPPRRGA